MTQCLVYGQTVFYPRMQVRVTNGDDKDLVGTIQAFHTHTDILQSLHGPNHYIEQTSAHVLFPDGGIRGIYPWNMVPHPQESQNG